MKIDSFIKQLSPLAEESFKIDEKLFKEYDVKRGLRNADHTGVLVGLTRVGSVVGYEKIDGKLVAIEGKLIYRGIDINDIVHGCQEEKRFGYDETVFLLLFGRLPVKEELERFSEGMAELRPTTGTDVILGFAGDTYNLLLSGMQANALGVDLKVGYLCGLGEETDSELMREA